MSKMRVFSNLIILVLAAVVVQAMPDPEKMKQFSEYMQACAAELNVEIPTLTPGQKPDFSKFKTAESKCMPKCIFEKFGYIDAQANLMEAKLKSVKPPLRPGDENKIKACFEKFKTNSDPCNKFKEVHKCMRKQMKKLTG